MLQTSKQQSDLRPSRGKKANVDFSDVQIAFASKTDKELKKSAWLFGLMNNQFLVNIGSKLMLIAIRLRLPFVKAIIHKTIFTQFCGGRTLLETKGPIDRLNEFGVESIFNLAIEGKEDEKSFNRTMNETIRAVEFAGRNHGIPAVGVKITGFARFALLEGLQEGQPFTKESRAEYKVILKRVDAICHAAAQRGIQIYFDADESWIQNSIDHLVTVMMRRYNRERVVIFNTFQLYRHDRLQFLIDSFNLAKKSGYLLGAKLVRGAYMVKERERADRMGYLSPIQKTKQATDDAFNTAIRFCLDNYKEMAFCCASHNEYSTRLLIDLMVQRSIPSNHPHIYFCQLYGMSDNLTFNLAKAGFNVAKYIVYGPVREVIPFLVRRAQENTAVTGEVGREYSLLTAEIKRRKL